MSAAVQHHDRSRSDSLQRMLDLEKKMMLQRTQSLTYNSLTGSVLPSPIPQPRRFELVPKDGKKAPPPVRNYGSVPPPLFPNNSVPSTDSNTAKSRKVVSKGHLRTNSAPIGTMEKTAQKQVAFAFPPDVEGHGQSPSREAHEHRKQERKERKEDNREERRGREQTVAKEKPRGRRLSKAPPLSRNLISQGHGSTEPVSPSKDKRSSSVLGISITRRDTADTRNETADRPRRGRSGSLTSAIRSSFEIRRGSYDQTSASGFLGGVKLEKKKQDFTQQVIEDQSQHTSKVHPALRKSFLGHGSFTPLKTDTTQPTSDKETDAQKRAYPPISIQTSGAMSQAAATQAPIRRDSVGSANIYLWSARATKKTAEPSNEYAVVDDVEDDEAEPSLKGVTLTDTPPLNAKEMTGLTRRGGLHIKTSPRAVLTSKFSTDGQEEAPQNGTEDTMPLNIRKGSRETTPELTEPAAPEPQSAKSPVIEPKDKVSYPPTAVKTRPRRESTASAVSNPPAPPRKSSKRSSIVLLARASTAPVEASKETQRQSSPSKENLRAEKKSPIVTKLTTGKRNATPPSIRYESTMPGARPTPYPAESPTSTSSKWNFKDTAKSAFGRGESASGSGNSYQTPVSPISSTGSFFKGRNSPAIPSSPLRNETTALASTPPHIDVQLAPKQMATIPFSSHSSPSQPSAEHLTPKKKSAFNHWRPMTSSSDDSLYSEALHSSSGPGTPDTSPPQSDSGYPPRTASGKRQPIQYSPCWSTNNSPEISSSDRFQLSDSPHSSESDVDPVEAAARRVMEAFSHANLHSPMDNRKDLESSEDSASPSTPEIQPQPRLRHREKSKGRLRTSQTQTIKLSQSTNGVKTTRSTPNLDVRSQHHKKVTPPVPDVSKNHASRPNPQRGDRVGKIFVVCCECKRYHDIPVKLYKTMLNPGGVFEHAETKGFEDRVCMTVKCSWCDHQMSTKCCPGVSGILDIQARMH